MLDFIRLLLPLLQLLRVALQADTQVVGGVLECAAYFRRDARSVGVGVVERGELGLELCADAAGE